MRILQVNSAATLGGAEMHVLELTETLRGREHEVMVAGRSGGPVNARIELPFLNSADLYSSFRLRQIVKAARFDVVHAHLARDYPVVCAALWGLTTRLVCTRHLLYALHSNPLYRRIDGWIAPTAQILKTLSPLHPKRSIVIPNWVDVSRTQCYSRAFHNPIHLGMLGQIAPHKGHDDAVEALRILGDGYRLFIGGEGEKSYLDSLKRSGSGLPMEFIGFVDRERFFATIDLLLVPSWEEPFGLVILEAMACGVPVIATAAGGPLEIIRPDVDGILIPPRSPQAIADAVRVLRNEQRRNTMIWSARERVEAEFDMEKIVLKIEEFYGNET
jgi:glycosyltransferase involved in cell wall biosynthesis